MLDTHHQADISASAHQDSDIILRVGIRMRKLRDTRGMTRRALAARADISERYLAMMEVGAGNVSLLLLERIARALDTPMSALVAEAE